MNALPGKEKGDADAAIRAFISGRLGYDGLLRTLKQSLAGDPANARSVRNALDEAARDGRLPVDLVQILTKALPPGAPLAVADRLPVQQDAAPGEADDLFDEATIPHAVGSSPESTGKVPSSVPPPAPLPGQSNIGEGPPDTFDIRGKVDDVVLSALVGEFRGMRRARDGGGEPVRGGDRADALDGLLSNYRSARFRADARRAVRNGVSEGSSLGKLDDLARPRAGIGSILRDRFILDAEIGRGGMGIVYAAVDRRRLEAGSAEPYVALKLLNDAFRNDSEALRVLESEARKAQSLAHPNIATVYDFDRDRSEIFIVMELLSGKPLSRHLAAATGRGLPGERIATILKGICAGLAHAHERGVVHSDLKPANVFITDDNAVKLLDFGLASAGNASGFDVSTLNALTAPYASPEMFEGAERDPRDDIFALGCIAYQLLMGTHPFAMKPTNEAVAENMVPEPIPDLDPAAWAAIVKALCFDRKMRMASVTEFFDGIFES